MLHGRTPADLGRRGLLKSGAYALAAASAGWSVLAPRSAAAAARIVVKYDWLISNGQIGDVVALKKGYFEAEGLDVTLSPGGPNSATVPPVIAGQAKFGQFSDSAQLLLARAAGVPVKIMACGFRASPFAFYSLPRAPIRSVQDMVGKRIGVQPTARFVLDAILVKNKIDPSSLVITNIGFDMTPLMTGQVDAVTGWITNTKALAVIGPDRIDLPMKDTGLPSYANVYFATDEALRRDAETLAKALRAIAKGWAWTHDHPEDAANLTVDAYPQLDRDVELKTVPRILALSFDAATKDKGWGTFDPAALQEQIAVYDRIGQFKGGAPRLEDCFTDTILTMTAGERPKFA